MTSPLARRSAAAVALTVSALVLSACASSGTTTPRARQITPDVSFTGCDVAKCADTLNGAPYEIVMPATWNGTLLIYSHGYRYAAPAPPAFDPVNTKAEPAPGWSGGDKATGQALLDQGFALAGSAYKSNGWAVADGVAAAEDLYDYFKANVGDPYRTIVWGDSLGGLITQTIAEKHPEWVDGVAPFCGALAGVVPNMNLALDVSYAVKTLLYPEMKLTGYATYEEAVSTWTEAVSRLVTAASDTAGGGTAKVLYIAALIDAPSQTRTYDGSTVEAKVKATVEALATGLGYATFARYDLEDRFGGNPSSNEDVDYATRISDEEKALIDAVTAGATAQFDALMAAGQRVPNDAAALTTALAEGGDPKGIITDPTITLHTASDPLVLVQNQSFFAARYLNAQSEGTATNGLVELFTVAPATYPEDPGAPYGAGHCNFTPQSRVAVITLLNGWVQNGVFPGTTSIEDAMGKESGFSPLFYPGPWPDPTEVTTG
jgi:pimeloyl-ACP methyl ester carboxylesterase